MRCPIRLPQYTEQRSIAESKSLVGVTFRSSGSSRSKQQVDFWAGEERGEGGGKAAYYKTLKRRGEGRGVGTDVGTGGRRRRKKEACCFSSVSTLPMASFGGVGACKEGVFPGLCCIAASALYCMAQLHELETLLLPNSIAALYLRTRSTCAVHSFSFLPVPNQPTVVGGFGEQCA